MENIRIILSDVEKSGRWDSNAVKGLEFSDEDDIRDRFTNKVLIFTLDGFVHACNNEGLHSEQYWITYVTVKN